MSANLSANKALSERGERGAVMVRPVRSAEDLNQVLLIRNKVFVEEMGIPHEVEYDRNDVWPIPEHITHYLVTVERQPIATCRLNKDQMTLKLERMAVASYARGKGIGRALLSHVERQPLVSNFRGAFFCHAVKDKELFYRNSGWVTEEGHGALVEGGLPHVAMVRRRRPSGASTNETSLSHVMIRTMDIARARRFYSLLGFQDVSRFRANGVRGAWIETVHTILKQSPYIEQRIELLEMKTLVTEQQVRNAYQSGMADYTPGLGHICFDVSRACTNLTRFLCTMQKESVNRFQMSLRVVEKPRPIVIGSNVLEISFISDADGTLLELAKFVHKHEHAEYDAQW
ncbi:Acetyltransferase (GNAT) [Gracilaria domingensis]|nr:Acetyltransferase (GNAT) [Gracilaria domingensis]